MNRRDSQVFKDLYTKYNQIILINELTKIKEKEWASSSINVIVNDKLKEEEWARQSINATLDSVLTAPNTPCSTKSLRVERKKKPRYSTINDSFNKSINIEKTSNSGSKRRKDDAHEENNKPMNEAEYIAIREEEHAMKPNEIITTRSKSKAEVGCPKDKVHQISSLTKKKSLGGRNSCREPQIQNAEEISKPITARKRSNSFDFESIDEDDRNCYEISARQTRSEPRKRHLKLSKGHLSKPKKSKRNTISTLSRNREAIVSTNRNDEVKRRNKIENQDVEEKNPEEISKPIKARKRSINESKNNKIYNSVLKESPIELPDFKKRYITNTERPSDNSFDFERIDEDDRNCYEISARQTRSEPRKCHLKLSKGHLSKQKKSKRNTISTLSRNREAIVSTNRNNEVKRRNKIENQDVEEKSVIVIEKRTTPLLDAATIKETKVNAPESEIQDPLLSDNVSDERNDNQSETLLKISSNVVAISVNEPQNKTSFAEPTIDDIGESVNIKDTSRKVAKSTRSCHRASHIKSTRRTKVKPRCITKTISNENVTLSPEVDINSASAVENTTQIESRTNAVKTSVDEMKESFQDTNKDEFKSLDGCSSTDRNATNGSKLDGKTYTEKTNLDIETCKTTQLASNEENSHSYNQIKPCVDKCFENHNDSNKIISINSICLMIPEEEGKQDEKISPYKPRNSLKHANDDLGKMFHVDELLRNVGVLRTSKVSLCVKAAIFNGHIDVNENLLDLKAVILEIVDENYCPCRQTFTATLENLMYQPDHGGYDREELNLATVKCSCASGCSNKDCDVNSLFPSPHAIYVTNICKGSPTVTTGHYHNHCDECPNFGMCIGDYRESHCLSCHEHFFKNGMEGLCTNCNH